MIFRKFRLLIKTKNKEDIVERCSTVVVVVVVVVQVVGVIVVTSVVKNSYDLRNISTNED